MLSRHGFERGKNECSKLEPALWRRATLIVTYTSLMGSGARQRSLDHSSCDSKYGAFSQKRSPPILEPRMRLVIGFPAREGAEALVLLC
jgi:hypothetical protein